MSVKVVVPVWKRSLTMDPEAQIQALLLFLGQHSCKWVDSGWKVGCGWIGC